MEDVVADAHKPQQCVEKLKTETIEQRRTAKQTKQTDVDNTDANDSFGMQISHANRVEDTRLSPSLSHSLPFDYCAQKCCLH